MKTSKRDHLKLRKKYLAFINKQEVLGEPFYDKIGQLNKFYLPICNSIYESFKLIKSPTIIGLSGGQGSGKTTITKILKIILKEKYNLKVVGFSIDDFYLTLKERRKLSKRIHKLLLTRGVPGTHDISLLKKTFDLLFNKNFKTFFIPKFDKSADDRFPKNKWKKIKTKPDIIIFEGWCVGANYQTNKSLNKPINFLEKKYDKKMIWRKKVNNELKNSYQNIFKLIDKMIYLQVPSFQYVYKWRLLQEEKLKLISNNKKIMTNKQVQEFVMFYERITKKMIKDFKTKANILIKLDKKHRLNAIRFN